MVLAAQEGSAFKGSSPSIASQASAYPVICGELLEKREPQVSNLRDALARMTMEPSSRG